MRELRFIVTTRKRAIRRGTKPATVLHYLVTCLRKLCHYVAHRYIFGTKPLDFLRALFIFSSYQLDFLDAGQLLGSIRE